MSGNDVVPSEGGVLDEFGSGLKSIPGAVKAIARLVGMGADTAISWLDVLKASGEQKASAIRNDTASALAISKAITKEAVKHASADEALAERAVATFMSDAMRKQENRERVAKAAVEDLEADPPPGDTGGPSDDWMNRFQRYAEDVSSEDVQRMWGRVLAAEIRRPGIVTNRVLRTIDEIDTETAIIFNKYGSSICGKFIIRCISGNIDFYSLSKLSQAGILLPDAVLGGHVASFAKVKINTGDIEWAIYSEEYCISFPINADINKNIISRNILNEKINAPPVRSDGKTPVVDVYTLTDVGFYISNIIFNNQYENYINYGKLISSEIGNVVVALYRKSADGHFELVKRIGA